MSVRCVSPGAMLAALAALAARGLRLAAVSLGLRLRNLRPSAGRAAPGQHSGAGSGRPLGACRLSQGRGPRPHRSCGARPVPPALQYRPRPARRRDHASRPTSRSRPSSASRAARTARTTSALARSRPAASATARSSRSTAACWSRASSILKFPAATAPASMCAAAPRPRRARRARRAPRRASEVGDRSVDARRAALRTGFQPLRCVRHSRHRNFHCAKPLSVANVEVAHDKRKRRWCCRPSRSVTSPRRHTGHDHRRGRGIFLVNAASTKYRTAGYSQPALNGVPVMTPRPEAVPKQ